MYVKESPEFFHELHYSKQNFKSLVKTVQDTLTKYQILKPFWEAIQLIINDTFFLSISDNPVKFRSRIVERLKMFYGLLKKGYEQSKYDKETFYYSEYELSFITLWSVLNEVQEAYFQKSQPPITINHGGSTYNHHPNGTTLTYLNSLKQKHQKWSIGSSVFCYYEYSLQINNVSNRAKHRRGLFQLSFKRMSPFLYKNNKFETIQAPTEIKLDYEREIRMQIAFILINKFGCGNDNTDGYIKRLNDSLKVRNHLYLTHGDSLNSSYFSYTEEEKRKSQSYNVVPQGAIKELFELAVFLLTSKTISLTF
jgi:hypothetical protein